MITSLLIYIIFTALNYLVGLLPTISDTGVFASSVSNASGYVSGVYTFLPHITTALLGMIFFDIVFETAYLLYKVIYWVIRRFPTQS